MLIISGIHCNRTFLTLISMRGTFEKKSPLDRCVLVVTELVVSRTLCRTNRRKEILRNTRLKFCVSTLVPACSEFVYYK